MAGSLNEVNLIGRLGADPEIRTMNSGDRCANFSLATSEKWKDKNTGEQREATEWHRVVVFDQNLVNVIERYVKKGHLIYLKGQLQTRKWQDNSGADRYSTEVVLQRFRGRLTMLESGGGRDDGQAGDRSGGGQSSAPAQGSGPAEPPQADLDDEVPF